jgi:hypothetical protein
MNCNNCGIICDTTFCVDCCICKTCDTLPSVINGECLVCIEIKKNNENSIYELLCQNCGNVCFNSEHCQECEICKTCNKNQSIRRGKCFSCLEIEQEYNVEEYNVEEIINIMNCENCDNECYNTDHCKECEICKICKKQPSMRRGKCFDCRAK